MLAHDRRFSKGIVLAVVLMAAALVIPAGLVRASGGEGTIQGVITDSGTHAPVANATVQVTATDVNWIFNATTNASGSYAISLPNHRYTVQVSAPAYYLNSTTVTVGTGLTIWNNMSLDPASARTVHLQGYVTDSGTSAPVTTGEVVVSSGSWLWPNEYTNASAINASGFYAMNLAPSYYSLATSGVQNYTVYTYSYLYLSSAGTTWFNFSMNPNPLAAWINGTVVDGNTYTPIVGANVTASLTGLTLPNTTTNATGHYSVHVPMGSVTVTADAGGYAPDTITVYVSSSNPYTPTIYLTPLSTGVHGYVRDGVTGLGIPGVYVPATPIFSGGYADAARTNATGFYAINLISDDYSVSVAPTGYTSAYSYVYLWGSGQWLNFTVWPIISTLRVRLTDGTTGLPIAGLSLQAYDMRSGYVRYGTSNASGGFAVTLPVSPAIVLTVYGTSQYAGTVDYLATYPYATTWANLTISRLDAVVQATVTDAASGLPISSASVTLSWGFGTSYGLTNANGVASVAAPSGLPLTVSAWASGYFGSTRSIAAISGTQAIAFALNPALTANVTVEGYVVDAATNASITFASVTATGYNGSAPWDYTDGLGYYSLSLVPAPQTIKVSAYGYAGGVLAVDPAGGSTIWANFSLATDAVAPRVMNFTATPATNLGPGNPTTLQADINESSFSGATMSLLMLEAASGNVGTFLSLGTLSNLPVSIAATAPGNVSATSTWDTRTPVARLSDAASSEWWPAIPSYWPFLIAVGGTFDNATLASPAYATAYFDSRSGALLYVYEGGLYATAQDQPTATFTPATLGVQLDLTSAAILGTVAVTGSTFTLGALSLTMSPAVPSGTYAGYLNTWDMGGNYAQAAVILGTSDTTPPVANAGPDQTVDQGATVTFNGSGSTDNVGIANYTWTFTDGVLRTLYGPRPSYTFRNAGTFLVTLTVRDPSDNVGTDTMTVTVRDITPPSVTITAPSANATVSGTVTLTATAADNVGVVRVEFLVDGHAVGNATASPYMLALNTRGLANGNHTIDAVAFDAAGNSASSSVTVTVANVGGITGLLGLDPILGIGLLVGLAALALGITLLLLRRRKQPPVPTAMPAAASAAVPGTEPAMPPPPPPMPAPPPEQGPPR